MIFQVLHPAWPRAGVGHGQEGHGAPLTLPYACLHLDIKTLLGGNIQEHVKLKTIPVLDDVEAMAEGECCDGPK